MKSATVVDLLKSSNIVIPLYLYRLKDKLKLSTDEFVLLMYFYQYGELTLFDPSRICSDLSLELEVLLQYISFLTDKGLIDVKVIKNDKNVMEEYVSLSSFYQKVAMILMEQCNNTSNCDSSTIYERIEKEFGRTLSPMEYEIIKAWLDNKMSEELILEALREAVYNGVSNLRYIDKILYEWTKKGYKSREDVLKHTKPHVEEKKEKKPLFDYNWLEDDDEEEDDSWKE